MFDLGKVLEDLNITREYMAVKLGVSRDYLDNIIESNKENIQVELYGKFIQIESNEQLLPELLQFYQEFSENFSELESFLREALYYEDTNIPRRMVNIVEWLVTLADDIEQIRKGKDGLKIFFLVVCIESLYKLANPEEKQSKMSVVIDFFENIICREDREFILRNVKRSLADKRFNIFREENESYEDYEHRIAEEIDGSFNTEIDIQTFAKIINEVRNMFVHEGNFWEFHFPDGDGISLINSLVFAETYQEFKLKQKNERIYEINLTYRDFRRICVKGYIRYICNFLASLKNQKL
ncbi:hypothetical protein [Desulfitobacterium sp.]|uniref:hypothetical protein n=1 Tax=Desulfitobacterium sp. TaxID=49981 RepID=UPI002BF266CE|nr:hypothetical protein [Desulfitobacterium sp.]HVJ49450.1 hypothetical protein [Desulfitobacterium sp.]